ncbi:MAG: DUF3108 domain-containing protein [bacterium]
MLIRSLLLIASILPLSGLLAQCIPTNNVFREGEEITYTVSYNWGPVWVDAGLVTFTAGKELYNGKEAWHFRSTGKTFPSYDFIFKVRDYYDSWTDPDSFRSLGFKRYIYEGGYTLINTIDFDRQHGKAYSNTKSNNNPVRNDTLKLPACTFDMLTAVYYTRTLDIANMKPDEKQKISLIIDDGFYNIYIRSIGKEVVENTDGKKYRCNKLSAKMVEGTIFRGDEDVLVWVTDDANKVPIRIEAKIIVGTIKAYLREAKGLKNPQEALLK